ncbi:MAG: Lrp/AsnC family transcriptional regulator [Candidatus Methanomethylophilaceae archaeon]|nr:Lrp/AsnC family transcriptional regulator [Candidatus Methanomethylophilaceae archaeon]
MSDINVYDDLDMKIIDLLCRSSQGSYRQLAKELGIHPTTLIQRVKVLESKGIITGYRAKIDYMRLGFDFMGVIQIYVDRDVLDVQESIRAMPNVIAVFDVTGDCDSIAWVACRNREEFSTIVKNILTIDGVKKTNTSIVLNVIKDPMDHIPELD